VVDGNRLAASAYELRFREDIDAEGGNPRKLCPVQLDAKNLAQFRKAVEEDYYFQMFYDDLPLWGFLGKVEKIIDASHPTPELRFYLFTHLHFEIFYSGDQVIEINVSTDPAFEVDITKPDPNLVAEFSYSASWKPTTVPFSQRMDKYSRSSFLPQHLEIHWFSIVNSCVTVMLLTGFLTTILMRVLRQDFAKYSGDAEAGAAGVEAFDEREETGWKYIHADVFRWPQYKSLFCAIIGSGAQLFLLASSIFALACAGTFYPYNRGSMYTACIVLYALTSCVAGYVSGYWYKQMGGEEWVRNVLLTCIIFCGPFLGAFAVNNTVAIAYHSTAALPFGTICIVILIWGLVTFPLTVVGAIAGKNAKSEFRPPCRTSKYPREVPPLPAYRTALPQMLMAGILPFSAVYIELYYIFASVWGHKVYIIYSILAIVFVILVIVTAFITVALTYFQLAAEDWRWWWRSLLCGGAAGLYIYAYCGYYFYARSNMSGLLQTSFFFGYMLPICWGFFLMLGTVGWRSSLLFTSQIYKAIKAE